MNRFKLFVLVVVSVLFSLPAVAQVYDTFVIPIVGNTSGGGGTRWATDLSVFNPQPHSLKIRLTFLPTGLDRGEEVRVTVAKNATLSVPNVIDEFYDRSGTGSLLIAAFPEDNPGVPNDVLSLSFLVRSTTFNNASTGTYGQGIDGTFIGMQDFESEEVSAIAAGIRNSGTLGVSGYRTNVGALNTGRYSISLVMTIRDSAGRVVADNVRFEVPPQGHFQDRLPTVIDRGSIEFFVDDPYVDSVVFPYVSIVDNKSGDPVYVNPILLATPGYLAPSSKGAVKQTVGKKITKEVAREISANARKLGDLRVEETADGQRFVNVTE